MIPIWAAVLIALVTFYAGYEVGVYVQYRISHSWYYWMLLKYKRRAR